MQPTAIADLNRPRRNHMQWVTSPSQERGSYVWLHPWFGSAMACQARSKILLSWPRYRLLQRKLHSWLSRTCTSVLPATRLSESANPLDYPPPPCPLAARAQTPYGPFPTLHSIEELYKNAILRFCDDLITHMHDQPGQCVRRVLTNRPGCDSQRCLTGFANTSDSGFIVCFVSTIEGIRSTSIRILSLRILDNLK